MKKLLRSAALVSGALVIGASARAEGPIMPEKDPAAAEGPAVKYLDAAANKHPRLLITAERIPQLKAFYNSPEAKSYRDYIEGYIAECTVPADRKTNHAGWWGQEYGQMKLPTVALHYVLTKDHASFEKSVAYLKWLAGIADWTDGGGPAVADTPAGYAKVMQTLKQYGPRDERNSDTTASFTMVGAALTWDWLYNDLDPVFREEFRQVLWQHARAMYYGGHKSGNPEGGYWRGVPAYNHRWFRDWGLTLAALGAGEGKPEEQWLLSEVEKELQFMVAWMPADGSQHEGPYYGGSSGPFGMACEASDDLTGTHYLDSPFYRAVATYALDISAPGMAESLYFGDCFTKGSSVDVFFLKTAAMQKQADVMDGIRHALQVNSKGWSAKGSAWQPLIFNDPSVKGGHYAKLPTTAFLPDLGIAIARDSWQDKAVAAMFKCGPMGGYKAGAWRLSRKAADGKLPYENVAHDHPDANSFVVLGDGEYLAETDRYSERPGKLSSSVNTILINGIGQAADGQPEGQEWQQPGDHDMTEMGKITAYKDAGDVVVAEGEAAGSYLAYDDAAAKRSRPAIDRFRRTFIWVKGGYILTFDDIRSPKPVAITWLIQGAKFQPVNEAEGRYKLAKGQAQCEFQLVADVPLKSKIGISTANDRSKLMNWQQLQASAEGTAARYACVIDPWHKDVKVTLTPDGPDKATIKVSGPGIADTWHWEAAKGKFEAATWHGSRQGGFDITVDAQTAVPPAP